MFGQTSHIGANSFGTTTSSNSNPMKDYEVSSPPDDSVSAMEFSPAALQTNFLVAGSWDSSVRCWEVEPSGKTNPKQMKTMGGPVLDVSWSDVSINRSDNKFRFVNVMFFRMVRKFLLLVAISKQTAGIWDLIK